MLHQEGQSGRERDEYERQAVLGDQGKRRRRSRSRIKDADGGKRIFSRSLTSVATSDESSRAQLVVNAL